MSKEVGAGGRSDIFLDSEYVLPEWPLTKVSPHIDSNYEIQQAYTRFSG